MAVKCVNKETLFKAFYLIHSTIFCRYFSRTRGSAQTALHKVQISRKLGSLVSMHSKSGNIPTVSAIASHLYKNIQIEQRRC